MVGMEVWIWKVVGCGWGVGSGECVERVWKCKVLEKMVVVCVIAEVRWYGVIGLVSKWWSGGGG